jgi:alkanesulfonate monooxygenase SsuD/methylene tetrahydromethanopterin reductase-like flavin-dependent oxidoreductase (luciferase family)
MARHWSGATGVGPASRPTVLIGGGSDIAIRRAARHGDGWTMGGAPPDAFPEALGKLRAAWEAEGREGTPRTAALFYYALGDDPEAQARAALGDYYAFLGDYAQQVVAGAAKDADTVRQYLAGFEAAGTDDVICFPASADVSQVDRLAEAALS